MRNVDYNTIHKPVFDDFVFGCVLCNLKITIVLHFLSIYEFLFVSENVELLENTILDNTKNSKTMRTLDKHVKKVSMKKL